jgi:1,2-phenylacetyl-CoA epoxidase PaaB subunit
VLRLMSDWDRVEVFRRNSCSCAYKNQASFIVPDTSKERNEFQNKNICNLQFTVRDVV